MKRYYVILLFCSYLVQSQATYQINVPESRFQIDEINNLIVCKIDIAQIPDLKDFDDVDLILNTNAFGFNSIPGVISYQTSYVVSNSDDSYTLYFSIFPLISIDSSTEIVDEPKRVANFTYADSDEIKTSLVGIELRGGFSQTYPKKTYDLEFWEDETGNVSKSLQFGDLREDDDWILDALYNEPLRVRAFSSHQLWLDMHTPYYLDLENEAKAGANVMFSEVFLNNKYIGIYMISEQVDRKQLKLKKYKDETVRGELYKAKSKTSGNARFLSLPSYNNSDEVWGDFELKLPDPNDAINWVNLHNLVDFVIYSDLETFRNEISNKVKIKNVIDYFIFLNLTRATDNRGKNTYVAKYTTDEPYFFVPWDLDGVFGTNWRGLNDNITDDILSNGLFDKLLHISPTSEIIMQMSDRWTELRGGALSDSSLESRFNGNFNLLNDNLVLEREALIWQNYPFDENSKNYMLDWLNNRLQYLDSYFGTPLDTASFDEISNKIAIYPNPTKDFVIIQNKVNQNLKYNLYNTQGLLITGGTANNTINKLSLNLLAHGVYFLKFENNIVKKIVKY